MGYQILPQDELKSLALEVLFDSLLQENVTDVTAVMLGDERSRQRFLQGLRDGSRWSRVRVAWHLAGSVEAAAAIATSGICCDEEHCACGRGGEEVTSPSPPPKRTRTAARMAMVFDSFSWYSHIQMNTLFKAS